jgi:hypothetical protein
MDATLHEPINVCKPLAPDVGIVDGPFEYLTALGIGCRCRSESAT